MSENQNPSSLHLSSNTKTASDKSAPDWWCEITALVNARNCSHRKPAIMSVIVVIMHEDGQVSKHAVACTAWGLVWQASNCQFLFMAVTVGTVTGFVFNPQDLWENDVNQIQCFWNFKFPKTRTDKTSKKKKKSYSKKSKEKFYEPSNLIFWFKYIISINNNKCNPIKIIILFCL